MNEKSKLPNGWIILNQLDLTNEFNFLCNWVGFPPFVLHDVPKYFWLMLEFLSMVYQTVGNDHYSSEYWEVPDWVYSRLLNRDYVPSLTE
jgi:hypothetical protein